MRVLIIEDEYNLADVISDCLKKHKYQVDIRTDGEVVLNLDKTSFITLTNDTYLTSLTNIVSKAIHLMIYYI